MRKKLVWIQWGAGWAYKVEFVRWIRMRMGTGDEDTNKIGVGALVRSDWLFGKWHVRKIPKGCRRGEYKIAPYHDLFRTGNGMIAGPEGKLRRPKLADL
jgi:hypothetical protein